ncbi:MAG: (d)CMP kinase [Pirellulaceae bacterium]|nr:(d)CMP kinase [Planctomycetales bacterium]
MIITIDGPAGAGKSTVARALARRMGFRFLDTGAMYRAVALAARRRSMDWADAAALAELTRWLKIEVGESHVYLDGEDVTCEIRSLEITAVIHHVADNPAIREQLVRLQRGIGETGDFVTEGRDQGTVVFPHAECKFFLTASPQERAARRQKDLARRGEFVPIDEVLSQQNDRDRRDIERKVGGLIAADDAIEFVTDGLSSEQVVDRLELLAREKLVASR